MPKLVNHNVAAICPACDAITTFEFRIENSREHGSVIQDKEHNVDGRDYSRAIYRLLRCAGCGRGGLSKEIDNNAGGILVDFYPRGVNNLAIPEDTPDGITSEFREAEICASVEAWRAGSALLRSTLEKTLKANGYIKGGLKSKINKANSEGVITDSRKKRAQDDIRVLGNDVLHDEWKVISEEEYELAHQYTQRIIEDFYDDREAVEEILIKNKRMEKPSDNGDEQGK